jgi:hypothetical protein
MIRVDRGESFPITVALWDEYTGENAAGQTVYYDVRDMSDASLTPALSGTLTESTVTSGIYKTTLTVDTAGRYICYATCSGFFDSSEEILVNPENIYTLVKQNRHYNISVEEMVRTNATPTVSQTARNVPLQKTDYIITKIKLDTDSDWGSTTISGIVYAHYRTIDDQVPYKMGGDS